MKTLFIFYLLVVCIQDAKTMYFSKRWILPSLILGLLVWKPYDLWGSLLGAILFGLPSLCMFHCRKDWIGSADVCFLFYFGWILGYERMIVAMFIALIIGFLWLGLGKRFFAAKEIPFVSCLAIGVSISLFCGYRIWYSLLL